MPTQELTPTIADGTEWVSDVLKVQEQNVALAFQTYKDAAFAVEQSIDGVTYYPFTNIREPGIYLILPEGSFLRLRADKAGKAPYTLFLYPWP